MEVRPAKGTNTLALIFKGGIIVAADSRTSNNGSVKKITEINQYMLATMAEEVGANGQFWLRDLGSKCHKHDFANKRRISVAGALKLLSNIMLYSYHGGKGLTVQSMIAGWDEKGGAALYYVDSEGGLHEENRFCVESGSQCAYTVLEGQYRYNMSLAEAAELARQAIYHSNSKFRNGATGAAGAAGASVYHVGPEGWKNLSGDDVGELGSQYLPVETTTKHEMADAVAFSREK
ncbi:OLC1v1022226C1 [Oldenlandia corymbosa var. corymbosa]|uniref:OLC1v1022226C1 n=1 Tax=Oldenlandia corymbosa var. corymbosa TaxID=529605 RepID=A0AAV1BY19_OLDCO|nr:OLC1v1022226C1 [Oldenlandia corymbosa var. corymbosa]